MSTENIQNLYELLQAADCDYCVYDTGRLITPISNQDFVKFEQGDLPYPYPIQQSAKFALVYWTKTNKSNPYIWFLNLPLDEESLINTGARNHFVAIITEALGASFAQDANQQKLPDNPYIKAPDEKKIALLNAKLKQKLNTAASSDYLKCAGYFNQPTGDDWKTLSVQGMADYVTDLTLPSVQRQLDLHYFDLPNALQTELASFLEHNAVSKALINKLIKQARREAFTLDQHLINCLRIAAPHSHTQQVKEFVIDLLKSDAAQSADVLSVICARCWQVFEQDAALVAFLEHISELPAQYLFDSFFADLVALPTLRNRIFALLKEEGALPKTRVALNKMLNKSSAQS